MLCNTVNINFVHLNIFSNCETFCELKSLFIWLNLLNIYSLVFLYKYLETIDESIPPLIIDRATFLFLESFV